MILAVHLFTVEGSLKVVRIEKLHKTIVIIIIIIIIKMIFLWMMGFWACMHENLLCQRWQRLDCSDRMLAAKHSSNYSLPDHHDDNHSLL